MERISTGIPDVDKKIQGGFPKGESILVTGEAGTGKTIFALHFLYNACKEGKKCALMATEERPEKIIRHSKSIGLDIEPFVESKQLTMIHVLEKRMTSLDDQYANIVTNTDDPHKIKYLVSEDTEVVVLDNIGTFSIGQELELFRDKLDSLIYMFTDQNWTALLVIDATAHELTHRIAEYSTYGTIRLTTAGNPYTGKMERYMYIPKMRDTEISLDHSIYNITREGIKLGLPKGNR